MLLSPLAIYRTLSTQALKQWSRQLLRVAACKRTSTPADTRACSVTSGAAGPLQQFQHCDMTTSQKQGDQLVQHSLSGARAAAMGINSRTGRASKASIAAPAAAVWGADPSSSSTGSETLIALDRRAARASSPATASTKSAKRKAAEALLAAQYGGLGTGSSSQHFNIAAVAGSKQQVMSYVSEASAGQVAEGSMVQFSKRPRSTLATAINRLGGEAPAANGAEPAAAVSTPAPEHTQQQQVFRQQGMQDLQQQLLQAKQQQRQRQPPEAAASSWQLSDGAAAAAAAAAQLDPSHLPSDDSAVHTGLEDAAAAADGAPAVASVEAAGAAGRQQRAHVKHSSVAVPACGPECSHTLSSGWCHSQVQLPHVDWSRVLESDMAKAPAFKIAQGYERMQLPGGIQVLVVEHHMHIASALAQLRSSMQDRVVAIDLEWRPETGRGFTPVAMVQLASSKVAVLIRTCMMGYRLPPVLKDFLKDPKVHLLGFSWAGQDEGKMQSTFGLGRKDFGGFMDLQQVAQGLGYFNYGLARLTQQVLGLHMPKSKKISTSNWEAHILSRNQVKYAALDVLVAGQVFRALRLWHSSPALCEVCHFNLGATSSQGVFTCCECDKSYWGDIRQYVLHCERYGHKAEWGECEGCGCARALPWPSSKAAAQQPAEQQPSSQQSS